MAYYLKTFENMRDPTTGAYNGLTNDFVAEYQGFHKQTKMRKEMVRVSLLQLNNNLN